MAYKAHCPMTLALSRGEIKCKPCRNANKMLAHMKKVCSNYVSRKFARKLQDTKMSYGETVLAVCAGTVAFVCLGVAAAYAAAWIMYRIEQ